MKIYYIVMFQFILSLFGCKKDSPASVATQEVGPFTIETRNSMVTSWNMNYGRVKNPHIDYNVKYQGKPLSFGDSLETNTGIPGIWRVFWFKDSPKPALLIGSQSLFLATEDNGRAVVKPLHVQGSDFASIQWLDDDHGQPGVYRELYSSDMFDREMELSGGRYLALSMALVLDTKTFETYPFNLDNELVEGYYKLNMGGAVAFSPDSTQVVYIGNKNDEIDYSKYLYALLSYNFKTGQTYAVPFDSIAEQLKDIYTIPLGWITAHFSWIKSNDGYKMILNPDAASVVSKSTVTYGRNQGYIYTIAPAPESLMTELAEYLLTSLNIPKEKMTIVKDTYNYNITIDADGKSLLLEYGQYGQDLVFKQESLDSFSLENKRLILGVKEGFEKQKGW